MTILANTYEASGTTQAVTVPYQSKPFLGFIFTQSLTSVTLTPTWGFPSAGSGAGGAADVFVRAFDDPTNPIDPDLSVTVSVATGPLLVIALSVSRDGPDVYNVSYYDVQTGTGWSGGLVPATGVVKENLGSPTDIATLGFVTAFLTRTLPGTATVNPTAPLAEIAEIATPADKWVIEVCRDTNPPNGIDKTLVVDGTYFDDGVGFHDPTQRIDGAVFTFHIASTFVRPSGGGWHIGKAARGAW